MFGINFINLLGAGVFDIDSIKQFHNFAFLFSSSLSNNSIKDWINDLSKPFKIFGLKNNSSKYELKIELIVELSISDRESIQVSKRFKIFSLSILL